MEKTLKDKFQFKNVTRLAVRNAPQGYAERLAAEWARGFALLTPLLEADTVVQTGCLKTHRFGGHFTLSLKNSVGLAAKYVPGEGYNYMGDAYVAISPQLAQNLLSCS